MWPFRRVMHRSWSRSSLGTATVFDKRHHPAKRPAGRVRMADATGNFRTRIRQKHRKSFHAFPDVMRGRGRSSLRDRPLRCARPRLCLAIVVMRAVIKQRQQNKALRCGAWAQPCRTVQKSPCVVFARGLFGMAATKRPFATNVRRRTATQASKLYPEEGRFQQYQPTHSTKAPK